MNGVIKTAAVAGFVAMMAQGASAASFNVDFEGLDANAGLGTLTIGSTVFSVSSPDGAGANLFDTTDGSTSDLTGDSDIVPAVQGADGVGGNVLIIQSPSDGGGLANDFAGGGVITFELVSGPAVSFTGFSAIDDGTFTFATSLDGDLGSLSLAENVTGSTTFASSFLDAGDSFSITYSGSGAVDFLTVEAIPLPATLPLLLAGVGGIGYMSRRRKAKKA
ncbi:MAG: VPLPA-CTERM sorting domain-containing protein [Roseobacter sp.]